MKKELCCLIFYSLAILLCAFPIHDVRSAQNIRFNGVEVKTTEDFAWVFWEESVDQGYSCMAMKFDPQGVALLDEALHIPLGAGSVKLVNGSATNDGGILIVYMIDKPDGSRALNIQKISSDGDILWAEDGIELTTIASFKWVVARVLPNNLGGAYVLHSDHNATHGFGKNFNAAGENIWTADNNLGYPKPYGNPMALASNGDMIYLHSSPDSYDKHLRRVNQNGETVGSDPMFPVGAPVPDNAGIIAASDGSYLLYTDFYGLEAPLLVQKLSPDGELVYHTLQYIPLNPDVYNPYSMKVAAAADGGFVFAHGEDRYSEQEYGVTVLKLDAELDVQWQTNLLINLDFEIVSVHNLVVDDQDDIWLALLRTMTDTYNWRYQLEAVKLSQSGTQVVSPQVLCEALLRGEQEFPVLNVYGTSAAIYWIEADQDQIRLKKHQLDQFGNPEISPTPQSIASCLNGSPELLSIHALQESSIVLMTDTRYGTNRIYYQVLAADGSPLLTANGLLLDEGDFPIQRVLAVQKSPQNTIYVLYVNELNSELKLLCLQELDASGNKLLPEGGLEVANLWGWYNVGDMTVDNNELYIYWTGGTASSSNARILRVQKLVNGSLQWEDQGVELDVPNFFSLLSAEGRYLVFYQSQNAIFPESVRALRIDESGNIDPAWDPHGLAVAAEIDNLQHQGSGIIGNDLYVFFSQGSQNSTHAMQKISPTGERMWGDSGIPLFSGVSHMQKMNTLLFSDIITMCYESETHGLRIQKISPDGEFLIPAPGFLAADYEYLYRGRTLAQYDSGAYSIAWINIAREIRHLYINPNWEINEVQHELSMGDDNLFIQTLDNSAHLVWTAAHGDFFDYEYYPLISIRSISFNEPVSIGDPTVPAVSGLALMQNYPNPFKDGTTIAYKLSQAAPVKLQIYNIKGQLLREETLSQLGKGDHFWHWDALDAKGMQCANGIYFYRIQAGKATAVKKMILIRND